jgi:bifunctional pyridoxal-dependent enzyme with beta-cystathionase and maltose regulon repressor activities
MKIVVMNDASIGAKTRRQIHAWWTKNKDMVLEAEKKLADKHMTATYSLEITQQDGVYQQWLDLKVTTSGLYVVMHEQPEDDQESGSATSETIAELQV